MQNSLSERIAEQLQVRRKIDPETAVRYGVVSKGNTIGFEYQDRGNVRFVKWRGPEKRFWIEPSGQKLMLWNIDSLRDQQPEMVIITEGEFDALSWLAVGAPYVVSVPVGAPAKAGEGDINPVEDDAFSYLWNGPSLIPELQNIKKVFLSTDGDKPGRILAEELAIRLGRDRCWLINYPEGCKDANEVLIAHGSDALMDLLEKAQPFMPTELVPITDLMRNPLSVAHSTGWPGLDDHLQIVPPELAIVTGMPNAGKTQFMWVLCANLSRIHGWRGAIIQFEDGVNRMQDTFFAYAKHHQHERKSIAGFPEKLVRKMIFAPKPEDVENLEASSRTMQWVLERVKEAGQRHGCRWVIIDPWNEIEHDWQKQYTETQYISRMLKLLKQAARRYTLAIFLIAHPKSSSTEKGIDEADLNDVAGGMAWNAKADHGIILSRHPTDRNIVYVKVSKVRDQSIMGVPGIVQMTFDRQSSTYRVVGKGV